MNGTFSEVSIWVDQFLGGIIGHGRFVHSLCSEESQGRLGAKSIQWHQRGESCFDHEDLPLGYCKVRKLETVFHLFSLGEAAWGAFHKAHVLSELAFQPALAGMIVVVERESVLLALERRPRRDDTPITTGRIDFSWFERQGLPYVIAAAGYQDWQAELKQLRMTLDLTFDVPMIPGPSLREGVRSLFDLEHADQVLTTLHSILRSGSH